MEPRLVGHSNLDSKYSVSRNPEEQEKDPDMRGGEKEDGGNEKSSPSL